MKLTCFSSTRVWERLSHAARCLNPEAINGFIVITTDQITICDQLTHLLTHLLTPMSAMGMLFSGFFLIYVW